MGKGKGAIKEKSPKLLGCLSRSSQGIDSRLLLAPSQMDLEGLFK